MHCETLDSGLPLLHQRHERSAVQRFEKGLESEGGNLFRRKLLRIQFS